MFHHSSDFARLEALCPVGDTNVGDEEVKVGDYGGDDHDGGDYNDNCDDDDDDCGEGDDDDDHDDKDYEDDDDDDDHDIRELAQLGWCRAAAASVGARPAPQQPKKYKRCEGDYQVVMASFSFKFSKNPTGTTPAASFSCTSPLTNMRHFPQCCACLFRLCTQSLQHLPLLSATAAHSFQHTGHR